MEHLPATSQRQPVLADYFPAPWQTVLWRNWGLVPIERIAAALQATTDQLRDAAGQLGLDPTKTAGPVWTSRGYLTIIRENWHLCTYKQILTLLDIKEETLAFILKEDDFFWHKMGEVKPQVDAPVYQPLDEVAQHRTCAIAACLAKSLPDADWQQENGFAFINRFTRQLTPAERGEAIGHVDPTDDLRTIYSYFALYGDPLMTPDLDPFPEALLAEYARMGVKGVWLQGLLYQLVVFPFDPELSTGHERRIANLNALIKRAAQYGIGVYLYLNEPRAMGDAFFQKYPDLRGTREGHFWALCTTRPEVKEYLESATRQLFTQAAGLAGVFTITMSENLTNCYSRAGDGNLCPRCARRKPWEVVAEVNNLIARGARAANPNAKVIAWNWAWGSEWETKVPALLTEGQIIQCTSETKLETRIGGISGEVIDYSMSVVGPGDEARTLWRAAQACGHPACAKVQFNNTWELSAVPWLPVFDKVARHVQNLKKEGVRNLQLSWTLGGYPSPNLKLAGYLMNEKGDVRSFLDEWLGSDLGAVAYTAQKRLSESFSEFPFHIGVLYVGPQNYGPMVPFYLKRTGWQATMIGFPYDDLDQWRAIYPRDVFARQFQLLVEGWREGLAMLLPYQGRSEDFDDMIGLADAALCHFESTWNQIRFVMNRDEWLDSGSDAARKNLLSIIAAEEAVVRRLIRLRLRDSRIGYESSNHYYYTLQDLAEKLINLQACRDQLTSPL